MLVTISDLHLKDGTSGTSINADAFRVFVERLNVMAERASWRADGSYRPIESITLVLLGDVFDQILSARWLEKQEGEPGYVRPWDDVHSPAFTAKIREITRGILRYNAEGFDILRRMSEGELITVRRGTQSGQPYKSNVRQPVMVQIFQLCGNHDWFFHLPGPEYDQIRQEVIDTLGLANEPGPFPHDPCESEALIDVYRQYHLFARHGDIFDPMNYNPEAGRDAATLGDAMALEMLNRFPIEVRHRFGDELSPAFSEGLKELTNVRPVLVTPMWITNLINNYAAKPSLANEIKNIWDELGDHFLSLDFVREQDKYLKFDTVDALQTILGLSDAIAFDTLHKAMSWATEKFWRGKYSISENALDEQAFKDQSVRHIVYGHTHIHEIVPLDSILVGGKPFTQTYFNAGTWHSYHDLTLHKPEESKFIGIHVMTYLAFFKEDERNGRAFESWSGSLAAHM